MPIMYTLDPGWPFRHAPEPINTTDARRTISLLPVQSSPSSRRSSTAVAFAPVLDRPTHATEATEWLHNNQNLS